MGERGEEHEAGAHGGSPDAGAGARSRRNALAARGTRAERGAAESAAGAVLLAGLALVLVGAAVAGAVRAGWDPAASVPLGDVAIPLWAHALASLGLALVLAVVALVRWRASRR